MSGSTFLTLGALVFGPHPQPADVLLLLREAQRARYKESVYLAALESLLNNYGSVVTMAVRRICHKLEITLEP